VKACNGECHYDFIAFDFEGDNMEDLIDLMGVCPFFAGTSEGMLISRGYTPYIRDLFGSKG
jgi:hypothetical protein